MQLLNFEISLEVDYNFFAETDNPLGTWCQSLPVISIQGLVT